MTSTTAKVTSTTSPAKGKAATTTPTTAPTTTTTSLAQGICNLSSTQQELYLPPGGNSHGVTPASSDTAGATVVLPDYAGYAYGRYVLGPAEMSGSIIKTATANLNSQTDQWEVDISFTGKGSSLFNKYAASHYQCYVQDESNPPYCALQATSSMPRWSRPRPSRRPRSPGAPPSTARRPTRSLPRRRPTWPGPELRVPAGALRGPGHSNVSPQIGTASLNAGAIAGAVAVLLVLIYLIIYYRALGLVVVIGICMSGAFIYAITTLLSATEGLALTLSGVIGLIVSVGVTADSCVVYFERLKEEIRIGRTVRTSVEKGFNRAFRTILAADFSSFIAALVLYTLTVGNVRGFAFFLGLATLLNVVTTYFFTRPLVIMMGRRAAFGKGGVLGVSRGLGAGAMGA